MRVYENVHENVHVNVHVKVHVCVCMYAAACRSSGWLSQQAANRNQNVKLTL